MTPVPHSGAKSVTPERLAALTRDAEHTPPPQHVVVPVDDLAQEIRRVDGNHSLGAGALAEALLPFLSERLASAPAPSSLAGGATGRLSALLSSDHLRGDYPLAGLGAVSWNDLRAILAALSPEAPAREGPMDKFDADLVEALDRQKWSGVASTLFRLTKSQAGRLRAALTPRHEAPAALCDHGHTDPMALCSDCEASSVEAPAEGAEELDRAIRRMRNQLVGSATFMQLMFGREDVRKVLDALEALRARSSAPEAREGEAVAWGRFGPDGSLIDLSRLSWGNYEGLYRHPAAPSADKLRIAVEALEPFANLGVSSGPDDEPCHYAYRITRGAIRNARQALSALKVEGA